MLVLDREFDFRGQKIAWGKIGQGDPIVLIHGLPWSAQAWRQIAPWLAANRTVYYFDMVGCGQSEQRDNQDVSETVQSDLLAALVKHWSLERPDVVGHDFGGLAALRGYFINGLRYRKLYLVNAVAVLPSGSPFFTHVGKHEDAFANLPAYAHEALFRAYIQRAASKPLRESAFKIYEEPWIGETGQAALYRQIAQADIKNIADVETLYRAMDCEVHLMWGENDTFIPIEQGKQLAKMLEANSFTPIPNAAHIVQEDAPEAIVATLQRY